jgi:hypothetical protein
MPVKERSCDLGHDHWSEVKHHGDRKRDREEGKGLRICDQDDGQLDQSLSILQAIHHLKSSTLSQEEMLRASSSVYWKE